MTIHKVQRGETLSGIAKKYGTTVTAIQRANPSLIKNVNIIQVGWSLTIPTPVSTSQKNYEKIGKQVEKVLQDINNLDSFKSLLAML